MLGSKGRKVAILLATRGPSDDGLIQSRHNRNRNNLGGRVASSRHQKDVADTAIPFEVWDRPIPALSLAPPDFDPDEMESLFELFEAEPDEEWFLLL